MKKLPYLLLIIIASIFISGCSNDVEINAEYEEIVVVYGLLDVSDDEAGLQPDTTYLKINKAFLGPDNALIMAQVPDSNNFIEKLIVEIWAEENPSEIITFDTITIDNKEDGDFYNPYQLIYYSPFKPDPGIKYKLEITHNQNVIKSEAWTIEKFVAGNISKPGFAKTVGFKYDIVNPVRWDVRDYAPRYDVVIRFHYKEIWEGSTDTVYRYFDWHKDTQYAGSETEVESYYNGTTFYSALDQYVAYTGDEAYLEDLVISRFTGKVEFIVEAGGDELNTYMEVNAPSSSIVQDRPEYSNIENGIGIFSSRAKAIKTKLVNDETKSLIKEKYWLKFQY